MVAYALRFRAIPGMRLRIAEIGFTVHPVSARLIEVVITVARSAAQRRAVVTPASVKSAKCRRGRVQKVEELKESVGLDVNFATRSTCTVYRIKSSRAKLGETELCQTVRGTRTFRALRELLRRAVYGTTVSLKQLLPEPIRRNMCSNSFLARTRFDHLC